MELVAKLHPLSQEDSDANNSSDLETSANPVSIAWFDLFLIQRVLCLRCFLRLWKNIRVSRKPCKQRSDLVLNGQMRVQKKTVLYRKPCC